MSGRHRLAVNAVLELPATSEKKVFICFDYEGTCGMPCVASYDIAESTRRVLRSLERHGARAIFFTVGALAVERPDLIDEIARGGHEIAVHGWRHEHLNNLSAHELAEFIEGLDQAEAAIKAVTGRRPTGFRAPYLLGPAFVDQAVYGLLAERGYLWASNRELRHVVQLLRPDRLRSNYPWRFAEARGATFTGLLSRVVKLALNSNVWRADPLAGSRASTIGWLWSGCAPFYRGTMLEIPLYSPMDCDLVGLPNPATATPEERLEFARYALLSTLAQPGEFTMLTFHDWIITGGNRLSLLDRLLGALGDLAVRAVTVEESWSELVSCAMRTGN